jgi:NADPH:quinone reductase-like Zn-dependent oxidoreductase
VGEFAGSPDLQWPPGDYFSNWFTGFLAFSAPVDYGAHGEEIIYPESALFAHPPDLSPEEASSVNTGLFLAYFALVELGGLKSCQYVVVTAATASTGIAALQLARGIRKGRSVFFLGAVS